MSFSSLLISKNVGMDSNQNSFHTIKSKVNDKFMTSYKFLLLIVDWSNDLKENEPNLAYNLLLRNFSGLS